MEIYCLQTYEYDTYSYSGISEGERFYFSSLKYAVEGAEKLGLNMAEYCSDPETEATLEKINITK